MKKNVYRIGSDYGYRAWIEIETRKVLRIDYESPKEGGTIDKSNDGETECQYSFLEKSEKDVYQDVVKFKETGELPKLYAWYDSRGRRMTIPFDYHEIEYKANESLFKSYEESGYVMKEFSDKMAVSRKAEIDF